MNDRFKFRIFDKETGKYYKSRINKCSGRTLYQHPSSSHCQWVTISTIFAELEQDEKIYTRTGVEPNTIIEQCTGLKDKNGNLIYEGDIVKQTQYDFDPVKRRVVTGIIKWHAGHAQFVFEYTDGTDGHNISEIGWGIIEIIGNIHEQTEQKDK